MGFVVGLIVGACLRVIEQVWVRTKFWFNLNAKFSHALIIKLVLYLN